MRSNFDRVGYISDFHDESLAGFDGGPNGVSTNPAHTLTSNSLGGNGSAVYIFTPHPNYWMPFSTNIHQGGNNVDLDAPLSTHVSGNLFHVDKFIGWNFNTSRDIHAFCFSIIIIFIFCGSNFPSIFHF